MGPSKRKVPTIEIATSDQRLVYFLSIKVDWGSSVTENVRHHCEMSQLPSTMHVCCDVRDISGCFSVTCYSILLSISALGAFLEHSCLSWKTPSRIRGIRRGQLPFDEEALHLAYYFFEMARYPLPRGLSARCQGRASARDATRTCS